LITAEVVALLVALEIVAVFLAFAAASKSRTPQGSVGWVVFLIAAPYAAVPVYLLIGNWRISRRVIARRASKEVIASMEEISTNHSAKVLAEPGPAAARAGAFEHLAGMPVASGSSVDLLIDGAQDYILICFYIVRDDGLGRQLKSRLIDKAHNGVKVRFLYDGIGCSGLPSAYLDDLRAAGIEVHNHHSIYRSISRFQINFRNHRKIVIVDGKVGFVGGLNVGDEYLGLNPAFGRWRDTQVRLRGPAVIQLQLVFSEDWYWATESLPPLNWNTCSEPADMDALVVAPGPGDHLETGSLYFCNAINAATSRVWIATPYFVPDTDILTALKLAALRGVDVRLLVPKRPDRRLVWLAAFPFYDEVRSAGVQIWLYTEGFMHQKVLVVDDDFASIGTVNLDNRSCRLNFELTVIVFNKDRTRSVGRMLEDDFAASRLHETLLSDQNFLLRHGARFARLFAPLL